MTSPHFGNRHHDFRPTTRFALKKEEKENLRKEKEKKKEAALCQGPEQPSETNRASHYDLTTRRADPNRLGGCRARLGRVYTPVSSHPPAYDSALPGSAYAHLGVTAVVSRVSVGWGDHGCWVTENQHLAGTVDVWLPTPVSNSAFPAAFHRGLPVGYCGLTG